MKTTARLPIFFLLGVCTAAAQDKPAPSYPTMAPADQYRFANPEEEVAFARTAAPPSISDHAKVLVLGEKGYHTAVEGDNGFVCFVERSWTAGFDDAVFWDPKIRAPNCFNAPTVVRGCRTLCCSSPTTRQKHGVQGWKARRSSARKAVRSSRQCFISPCAAGQMARQRRYRRSTITSPQEGRHDPQTQ